MRKRKLADERRTGDRFPIEREVHYRTIGRRKISECGLGQTVNISSSGVLFTTDRLLKAGNRLEVAISWPAQLNASVALQLVARGKIVRSDQGRAALEIQHYEFRTCSRNSWRLADTAPLELNTLAIARPLPVRIGPPKQLPAVASRDRAVG